VSEGGQRSGVAAQDPRRPPLTRSLGEAAALLRAPDATESFSPLTGEPLVIVDFARDGSGLGERAAGELRSGLARVPSPSVALHAQSHGEKGHPLTAAFDLAIESEAELEPLRTRVELQPLASLALVQLLRHGEALDVEGALVAESLVYATLQAGPEHAAWVAARETRTVPPATGPAVRVRRELDRLHLRLSRPERRNAFCAEMRDRICEGLGLALCDDSIREVVLSGAGPAFCSGGDLDEFGSHPDPATAHAIRSTRNVARLLAQCADRVVAQVHGACVGAGVELPAFAARVVARDDAFFQLPELSMGLVPGAGGTVSLPRRIGRQRTAWLALTGERIDAATALRWGLIDEIRPQLGCA